MPAARRRAGSPARRRSRGAGGDQHRGLHRAAGRPRARSAAPRRRAGHGGDDAGGAAAELGVVGDDVDHVAVVHVAEPEARQRREHVERDLLRGGRAHAGRARDHLGPVSSRIGDVGGLEQRRCRRRWRCRSPWRRRRAPPRPPRGCRAWSRWRRRKPGIAVAEPGRGDLAARRRRHVLDGAVISISAAAPPANSTGCGRAGCRRCRGAPARRRAPSAPSCRRRHRRAWPAGQRPRPPPRQRPRWPGAPGRPARPRALRVERAGRELGIGRRTGFPGRAHAALRYAVMANDNSPAAGGCQTNTNCPADKECRRRGFAQRDRSRFPFVLLWYCPKAEDAMGLILGIDGGGTGCRAAIADGGPCPRPRAGRLGQHLDRSRGRAREHPRRGAAGRRRRRGRGALRADGGARARRRQHGGAGARLAGGCLRGIRVETDALVALKGALGAEDGIAATLGPARSSGSSAAARRGFSAAGGSSSATRAAGRGSGARSSRRRSSPMTGIAEPTPLLEAVLAAPARPAAIVAFGQRCGAGGLRPRGAAGARRGRPRATQRPRRSCAEAEAAVAAAHRPAAGGRTAAGMLPRRARAGVRRAAGARYPR